MRDVHLLWGKNKMQWKNPPLIKIYEALGAIGDNRITIADNTAKIFSSSGNKFYNVLYDHEANAITTNDNGSYWQGYLGYPAITFLLAKGYIPCNKIYADALMRIPWKDINTKYKNNFEKTIAHIHELLEKKQINLELFLKEVNRISDILSTLNLNKLGPTAKPPEGY